VGFTTTPVFDLTNIWRFTTNNLDRINWQAAGYNDSDWLSGPGLLWADTRGAALSPVQPKGTQMPINAATSHPFATYYFRTHFTFAGSASGLSLSFSNYLDDGAVFYLNGNEIYRQNMAPAPVAISNATLAIAYNCGGDATCAVRFALSGNALTNLVVGDNVLAVEAHNYSAGSQDITFGSALALERTFTLAPTPHLLRSDDVLMIYWNGSGFILQEASQISPGDWRDVSGPVTNGPYALSLSGTNTQSRFFRIRNP
jgi:hypothetical protein